ncbi:hypothetical protein M413DRAFT_410597 [Hebeloma cylindrosporum]|uniref:Heme haloperoxidase family profile domain-containing protein n=1 Tax=Hebeloma cylindrosporum TaxID=76867 RepID=A0A0C2YLW2_HEBCY|nr:hypothetical protein M413DRAFT_410597 [Hebeloma cylindrosporum h7]
MAINQRGSSNSAAGNHEFKRMGSRSPCPALNILANHGYVTRDGTNLTFLEVVKAMVFVYNLSYPLAIFLAMAGFLTAGKLSYPKPAFEFSQNPSPRSWGQTLTSLPLVIIRGLLSLLPTFTLDLTSLSQRGRWKIAHDASFVHPNGKPSNAPDPTLVQNLLRSADKVGGGFSLHDIVMFHVSRVKSTTQSQSLDNVHSQVVLGECALTWLMLRASGSDAKGFVPVSRLGQWFGEERLPDNWWKDGEDGVRPKAVVGLLGTRRLANYIGFLAQAQLN